VSAAAVLLAVSLCDLQKNPQAYDHKRIEVTAFVSHGFEDFSLFDPQCQESRDDSLVWVEYGGTFNSGTIYCCEVPTERRRAEPLVVEDVPIPLREDDKLRQFDALVQEEPDSIVHATLRGRFFASGHGHFGIFSLLAIEQVVAVDPHDLTDVDYRAADDPPDVEGEGCHSEPAGTTSRQQAIAAQERAEHGEAWRFSDSMRVAAEQLPADVVLCAVQYAPGRVVYKAPIAGTHDEYWVNVARPYWLSFYAKNRKRVAWVVVDVRQAGCRGGDPLGFSRPHARGYRRLPGLRGLEWHGYRIPRRVVRYTAKLPSQCPPS
jgi:hypothetical protein